MDDYKILIKKASEGEEVTVWVSEIRGAVSEEEAVERFVRGFRSRPDRSLLQAEENERC